ncbi:pilus assembly protein PilM [Fontivita pretiosa]|uniref:pilus assembly protein PilM n=1 Tax=Fontivita pretiosa TaxID=2989684 RepID=UPI003D17F92B
MNLMRRMLGIRSPGPIGVDLGSHSVKAVQLAPAGEGRWRVHAAARLPLPVPNHPFDVHTVRNLRDVFERHGFVGHDLVVAAPARHLLSDVLEVPPPQSGAPIGQIARAELARNAKIDDDAFELAWWDLPAPSRGGAGANTSVMAVALRHDRADELLDPFEQEDFRVVAIDPQAMALARACRLHSEHTPGSVSAILDIGFGSVLLVLVRDECVIYQRRLPDAATGMLVRWLADQFSLADDEAQYVLEQIGISVPSAAELAPPAQASRVRDLVQRHLEQMIVELEQAFGYVAHRYADTSVGRLLVCGGGATIAGLVAYLQNRLGLPVQPLSPKDLVECTDAAPGNSPAMTMATGLALYAMSAAASVDLTPMQRKVAVCRRRRRRRWITAAAIYSTLVLGSGGAVHSLWRHGLKDPCDTGDLPRIQTRVADLERTLKDLKRQLLQAQTLRQTALALSDQPDWSILLALLGRTVGQDVTLRAVQLQTKAAGSAGASALSGASAISGATSGGWAHASNGDVTIAIRGVGRTQPGVAQFVLRLQQTGLFDDVRLLRTGREPLLDTTAVAFELTCTIRSDNGKPRIPTATAAQGAAP